MYIISAPLRTHKTRFWPPRGSRRLVSERRSAPRFPLCGGADCLDERPLAKGTDTGGSILAGPGRLGRPP